MNILITGATGFIGSHLVERLIKEKKHKLIIIKRKTSNIWRIKEFIDKCLVYDFKDFVDLENIFKENKIDLIVHLAAKITKREENENDKLEMIKTNVMFPSYLLEKCIKYNVNYFINTGSFFEYKQSLKPLNEKSLLKPFNFYAVTKINFENILKYYSQNKKIKGITLKLAYPFGEKDNNDRLVIILIKSIIKNQLIETTAFEQKWDFIYIDDVINAYIKAIDYVKKIQEYEIFNIGLGKTYSFKKIIKILAKISQKKPKILIGKLPYRKNEIMYFRYNIKKAEKKLNWKPVFTIEKALFKVYNFYKKNYSFL